MRGASDGQQEPDAGEASRAAALASLGALLLVLVLAAGLASIIGHRVFASVPPTSGTVWTRYYIDGAIAALPDIAREPGDVAIAVGASQTYYGFYPPAFDEAFAERGRSITSYNLAALGWTPFTVRLWTRRIADTLAAEGKRARIFLIGFTPHLMTEATTGHERWATINLPAQARFARWRDVPALVSRSPGQAARLGMMRVLGITPQLMREIMTQRLRGEPFRRALREEWALPAGFPNWPSETRGGQPAFVEYASREERLKLMRRHLGARVAQSGIRRLEISEAALSDFVLTVRAAEQVADQVFVVVTPRNEEIVHTSENGLRRLDRALEQVGERTSARVLNYYREDPRFALEDFIDATHLAGIEPRARFSRILAADVVAAADTRPPAATLARTE
jgi:hypothetical protein